MLARSVFANLLAVVTAAGCASGDLRPINPYSGDSGFVSWEVVGIRTSLSDDRREIRWNWTVILRETGGRGIQFESIETSVQTTEHPDSLMAATDKEPFRARLAPRGEYRFNTNYGIAFTPTASEQFGALPGGRGGVRLLYRLFGRDEAGQSVTVAIPVALHPGAGLQVPPPAPSPPSVALTASPPPPEPAGGPARRAAPDPSPAWAAARECAAQSTTLKVLDIGESGEVQFEHGPGEEEEFQACYRSRLDERLRGRLVDVPGAPLRTSALIEPFGTSAVVEVTIDRTLRARLLVDTGATITVLRPRLVERVEGVVDIEGLRPSIILASGGTVSIRLARLRSLGLGSFEVEDIHVGVYDIAPQLGEIDGLLGTDFLHRFVINVDSGARRLTLERKQ